MNKRRRLTGQVVGNKMDKTATVVVQSVYRHSLYGKVMRSTKKYLAHDEDNRCEIGDTVTIVESRPISKRKRWMVQEILREDISARTVELEQAAAAPAEAMVTQSPARPAEEPDATDDQAASEHEAEEA
jgi:small subunit ribosomal protein S17